MEILSGSVERIVYVNPENGYTVFLLEPEKVPVIKDSIREKLRDPKTITVVGNLSDLNPGEHIQVSGKWVNHPKHGFQFSVEHYKGTPPVSKTGIRRYLGSGLVKGIGPALANRIVDHFGLEALNIIEEKPERLRQVQDIGPKRASKIIQAWREQSLVKDIMLFLHSHGVSTNLAVKIYKTYGDRAVEAVQNDPYQLARDIYGVGFRTSDKIAKDLGLAPNHPSRIETGLVYNMNEMVQRGHVFFPQPDLIRLTAELLDLPEEIMSSGIDRLQKSEIIKKDIIPVENKITRQEIKTIDDQVSEKRQNHPVIYLTPYYYAEVGVTERLAALVNTTKSRLADILPEKVSLDPTLSGEQKISIKSALIHPVSVITGGPGTGKTTCLRSFIEILESSSKRYSLACPTGRAAKRLSEATGRPASTIHRLLGYSAGGGFKYNSERTLAVDCVIIDEASMLDILLTNNLLKALEPGAHLLLVGDVDQLPSVGAGNVLKDVIGSGLAQVTRLKIIFRQAADSLIIENAHKINQGEMPLFPTSKNTVLVSQTQNNASSNDFFLFSANDAETAANWIRDIVIERIPKKFGYDSFRDIQVLAPMHKGIAGVTALNKMLQDVLNQPSSKKVEVSLYGNLYRSGDKVMQIRNNYDKDVFNGDIGFIQEIDIEDQEMYVVIDDREVRYEFGDIDQLVLAYAVTVHKSQGSEFPVIVMPIITSHYLMLQRNLLYTAVTRAKNLCVLIGNRKAIGIAVGNNKVSQRFSGLDKRLSLFML